MRTARPGSPALLAGRSQHWAPADPDLLIAAAAELTVLHMDKDFQGIAAMTGQPPRTPGHRLIRRSDAGIEPNGITPVKTARRSDRMSRWQRW